MWLLLLALASAELRFEPAPVDGAKTVLTVVDDAGRPRSGVGVRVVQRPGLPGERQTSLGLTDSLGRVEWTPEVAGSTIVRVGSDETPLIVRSATPPVTTLSWLGLLALAATATAAVGLTRRRTRGHPHRSRH